MTDRKLAQELLDDIARHIDFERICADISCNAQKEKHHVAYYLGMVKLADKLLEDLDRHFAKPMGLRYPPPRDPELKLVVDNTKNQ